MRVFLSRGFERRYVKLPIKIQKKFESCIGLFLKNPYDQKLKNHPLRGNLLGFRAFSITGDYRVIFVLLDTESVKLIDIGKHTKVYGD